IHMDPVDYNDPKTLELRCKVNEIVKGLCGNASIHDFRVVYGNTHINLVFDVLLPFDAEHSDKDFVLKVQKRVKAYDEKLNCVIHIDKDYTGH
ncbi:MAG: cation-efflux pump, partial [Clostridia bacterium]|nr:cation-efflux pump [Clostridia bacterium]